MNNLNCLTDNCINCPHDKSIAPYELEAFCNFMKQFEINRIVESGTYKGVTAKRLSLIYPNYKIYSFEIRIKRYLAISKKNCAENIRFKLGNLKFKYLTSNTAVIIDGPKRLKAIKLAKKCRKIVPFVAIHDMNEYRNVLKTTFEKVEFCGVLAICV